MKQYKIQNRSQKLLILVYLELEMSQRQTELLDIKQNPKERHVRSRSRVHLTFNNLYCGKISKVLIFKVRKTANSRAHSANTNPQFFGLSANLQISLLFPSTNRKSADFSAQDSKYETPQKFFHFIAKPAKSWRVFEQRLRTSHLCKMYTLFTFFISFNIKCSKSILHSRPGLDHPSS